MNLPTHPLSLDLPVSRKLSRGRAFRARKKITTEWLQASPEAYKWFKQQPALEELGDFLFLAPDIKDELWLLIERVWNGWPDPPTYGFVVYDLDGKPITAKDFDRLPKGWTIRKPEPP